MRVALYIPNNWMHELADELSKHVEVHVNRLPSGCDAVLGMSESMVGIIPKTDNLFLYQWDCYNWRGNPQEWVDLMKQAKEIWSASHETAQNTFSRYGVESRVIKCFVPKIEYQGATSIGDYVIQGGRKSEEIRWDWFERACQELQIPYICAHPDKYSREEYLRLLANSRAVISTRDEASTGGLTLFEGAYFNKPLLAADCVSTVEYFQDTIRYFIKDSYEDFKRQLQKVYNDPPFDNQLAKSYTVAKMASDILQRITK